MDSIPSVLSHVSIGTNDFERAAKFYDAVLPTIGCKRVMQHQDAVAYGKLYPEFWVQSPSDGKAASVGNGFHIAFIADSKSMVDDFHRAAMAAGATDDGAPGPRPEYGAPYYGCFLRDPDGHKIEATFWDRSIQGED